MFIIFHFALFVYAVTVSVYLIKKNPSIYSLKKIRGDYIPSTSGTLEEIPFHLRDIVRMIEDTRFFEHSGIDLRSINRALDINKAAGKKVYGGSTITQQLARTLFLSPSKNYFRKYSEVLIALVMESVLSKQRILELYFNCAEWGNGVYGIFDAAMAHYSKPLDQLSIDEQLRLITILPNPILYTVENIEEDPVMSARYSYLKSIADQKPYPDFKSDLQPIVQ